MAGANRGALFVLRPWAAAGVLGLVVWSPLAAAEDRSPVLLRDSTLEPPIEVAGTGLAPEVKVRVKLDERGRVTEVGVLSIKPESEYDEFFRRDTIDALLSWRYAPAIRHGVPAAETLDWIVQFKPRVEGDTSRASRSRRLLPWFVELNRDADARRAWVLNLPPAKRREILTSHARTAERFLIPERRQQFATPRFLVVTDAESPDLARIVANNLEATLNVLQQQLVPEFEAQPNELKTLVYAFARRAAYLQLVAEASVSAQPDGFYQPPGLIAVHLEQSAESLMSLLIHEETHGFSDQALRRPGTETSFWLEEGLAEYMGNSQIKKGHLLPGNTLKRQYVLSHQAGVVNQVTGAGWDLKRIKATLRAGEGLDLEELVAADKDLFYGDRSSIYYGMSWLFVHFLRHGESSWADGAFPILMLYAAEGYPAREAIEAAYERDLATLKEPFLDYVSRF